MEEIIHEEGNFIWIYCPHCLKRLGVKMRLVKSKKPDYKLTIEDAHRIYELGTVLFYPEKDFRYEDGCERASWHIIPLLPGKDDHAE
jgi:hypothetical protein